VAVTDQALLEESVANQQHEWHFSRHGAVITRGHEFEVASRKSLELDAVT
jgi:hypothetical protein